VWTEVNSALHAFSG